MFRAHMTKTSRRFKSFLLSLALVIGLAGAAVLTDPEPIVVPAGLSEPALEKAIRLGGIQRGWIIEKEGPGQMLATLNIRSHQAKVGIQYDLQQVRLTYRSSTNLDYSEKEGVRHIHANYLKWVRNLANDITVQLQLTDLKQPPSPPAAAPQT
jgi:hypothetical protein